MTTPEKEIIGIVIALGLVGIGYLAREFGKCAEETAEIIDESFDEVTQREEWNK